MRSRVFGLAAVGLLFAAGCHRSEPGLFVTAPFNDETKIAKVEAHWQAAGAASPEGETLHYEVRVANKLADRLFVRLGTFALTDARGTVLASGGDERSCVVPASADVVVLTGDIALSPGAAARVADFRVSRFGVPLSERGRAIYREFLLQSEKYTEPQVDAEIATYMRAAPCS